MARLVAVNLTNCAVNYNLLMQGQLQLIKGEVSCGHHPPSRTARPAALSGKPGHTPQPCTSACPVEVELQCQYECCMFHAKPALLLGLLVAAAAAASTPIINPANRGSRMAASACCSACFARCSPLLCRIEQVSCCSAVWQLVQCRFAADFPQGVTDGLGAWGEPWRPKGGLVAVPGTSPEAWIILDHRSRRQRRSWAGTVADCLLLWRCRQRRPPMHGEAAPTI